jgi:amidase
MVEETAEVLRSLGHQVERQDPDYGMIGNQVAALYLGGIADDVDAVPYPERLEGLTRGYRRVARVAAPRFAVRRAKRLRDDYRARIGKLFDRYDILLMPLSSSPPFEVGRFHDKGALRCLMGETRIYPNAVVWNYTGQPAASVPAGLSKEGLPLGIQLIGRPNDEATVLSLSAQLEAERPWAEDRPPVS